LNVRVDQGQQRGRLSQANPPSAAFHHIIKPISINISKHAHQSTTSSIIVHPSLSSRWPRHLFSAIIQPSSPSTHHVSVSTGWEVRKWLN
jgi:hypothetical protein